MRARKDDVDSESNALEHGENYDDEEKLEKGRGHVDDRKVLFYVVVVFLLIVVGFFSGEYVASLLGLRPVDETIGDQEFAADAKMVFEDDEDDGDDEGLQQIAEGEQEMKLHQLLIKYYTKYNPDRTGDIPTIIEKFGKEPDILFAKLKKKYGKSPLEFDKSNDFKSIVHDSNDDDDEDEKQEEPDGDPDSYQAEEAEAVKMKELRHKQQQRHIKQGVEHQNMDQQSMLELLKHNEEEDDGDDDESRGDDNDSPYDDGNDDSDDDNDNDIDGDEEEDGLLQKIIEEDDQSVSSSDGDEEEVNEDDFVVSQDQKHVRKGKLKVICIGLPMTGLNPIRSFLKDVMEYNSLSDEATNNRLANVLFNSYNSEPEFNLFSDVEAVSAFSSSYFFEEIMHTYPSIAVVIAVRHVDDWYNDIKYYLQNNLFTKLRVTCQRDYASHNFETAQACRKSHLLVEKVYHLVLGNTTANEFLFKRRYYEFYDHVLAAVPRSRRKLIDLYSQSASSQHTWQRLFSFLHSRQSEAQHAPQGYSKFSLPLASLSDAPPPKRPDVAEALSLLHLPPWFHPEAVQANGQLRLFGLGMPRTGDATLASAISKKLQYSKLAGKWLNEKDIPSDKHSCRTSDVNCVIAKNLKAVLVENKSELPGFGFAGVFHGVDFVYGLPGNQFFEEVLLANPNSKFILTVRPMSEWLKDMRCQSKSRRRSYKDMTDVPPLYTDGRSAEHGKAGDPVLRSYLTYLFGSVEVNEYIFKKKYKEYVERVKRRIPTEKLLIVDIGKDNTWRYLCDFLLDSKCTSKLISSSFPSIEKLHHC